MRWLVIRAAAEVNQVEAPAAVAANPAVEAAEVEARAAVNQVAALAEAKAAVAANLAAAPVGEAANQVVAPAVADAKTSSIVEKKGRALFKLRVLSYFCRANHSSPFANNC